MPLSRLEELPDPVLEQILWASCDGGAVWRRTQLATLSRRLATVVQRSPLFWSRLRVDCNAIHHALQPAQPALVTRIRRSVFALLASKVGVARSLELREAYTLQEALLRDVLRRAASSTLVDLELSFTITQRRDGRRVLELLARCFPSLQRLALGGHAYAFNMGLGRVACPWPLTVLTTLEPLSALTALRTLCLRDCQLDPRLLMWGGDGGAPPSAAAAAVQRGALGALTQLRELELGCLLSDVGIITVEVPPAITRLTALERLTLRNPAGLGPLPLGATGLSALSSVRLESVSLSKMPLPDGQEAGLMDTLHLLPALRQLAIKAPAYLVLVLSPQLLRATALQELHLTSVVLRGDDGPEHAGPAWPALTALSLSFIPTLEVPPSWVRHMTALRSLAVRGTKLVEPQDPLPSEISLLTRLERLEVRGYSLYNLATRCTGLSRLTKLCLRHVQEDVELRAGPYLEGLQELDLSGSRFLYVPSSLRAATALRTLSMAGCRSLGLGPACVATLASLPHLESFSAGKRPNLAQPERWGGSSMQAVADLARLRPGLRLALTLTSEELRDLTDCDSEAGWEDISDGEGEEDFSDDEDEALEDDSDLDEFEEDEDADLHALDMGGEAAGWEGEGDEWEEGGEWEEEGESRSEGDEEWPDFPM